jgi:hypothetical protein
MRSRARSIGASLLMAAVVAACGGGGGGGGGAATAPPRASLPPDLPIVSCFPNGPFTTAPCERPIEAIYALVAASGPFDGVRVTTVGVNDCAAPRDWPSSTPRPAAADWHWMVRFEKGGTDYGGFVGTGGKIGEICLPFTGQ